MALNCEAARRRRRAVRRVRELPRIWSGGSSLDVVEMDAASNRGVDDARELRERAMYAPTGDDRYKVYIVDEAHMLTREAWNALLKVLEEPPPRVVFVFATTEPQKIAQPPRPILSRLQRFDLKRIGPAEIRERLAAGARREGVRYEPDASAMIARAADGGLRDALSLTDQVLSLGADARVDRGARARGARPRAEDEYLAVLDLVADGRAATCSAPSARWPTRASTSALPHRARRRAARAARHHARRRRPRGERPHARGAGRAAGAARVRGRAAHAGTARRGGAGVPEERPAAAPRRDAAGALRPARRTVALEEVLRGLGGGGAAEPRAPASAPPARPPARRRARRQWATRCAAGARRREPARGVRERGGRRPAGGRRRGGPGTAAGGGRARRSRRASVARRAAVRRPAARQRVLRRARERWLADGGARPPRDRRHAPGLGATGRRAAPPPRAAVPEPRVLAERWDEVVAHARAARPLVGSALGATLPVAVAGSGAVTVELQDENDAFRQALDAGRDEVLDAVRQVYPGATRVVVRAPEGASASAPAERLTAEGIRADRVAALQKRDSRARRGHRRPRPRPARLVRPAAAHRGAAGRARGRPAPPDERGRRRLGHGGAGRHDRRGHGAAAAVRRPVWRVRRSASCAAPWGALSAES
jgi:DNA polymerase-3 subunit gamma/tau